MPARPERHPGKVMAVVRKKKTVRKKPPVNKKIVAKKKAVIAPRENVAATGDLDAALDQLERLVARVGSLRKC